MTIALTVYAEFSSGVWTDITTDILTVPGVSLSIGHSGVVGPTDLVFPTGTARFRLSNSKLNSAGLVGYYSPDHTNCRSGFEEGLVIRVKADNGTYSRYLFHGRIAEIRPIPDQYGPRYTEIVAVDYMDVLATSRVPDLAIQTDALPGEVLAALLATLDTKPSAAHYDTGPERLPYAGHTEKAQRTLAITVCQKIAQSCLGVIGISSGEDLDVGDDVVVNGGFDTDTDWTKQVGWSISGGKAHCDGTQTVNQSVTQDSLVLGVMYKMTFTVSNYVAGAVRCSAGYGTTGLGIWRSANGTYVEYHICAANVRVYVSGDVDFVGSVDNVSYEPVLGTLDLWDGEVSPDNDCWLMYWSRHHRYGLTSVATLSDAHLSAMRINRNKGAAINSVSLSVYPVSVDTSPVVLAENPDEIAIAPGETLEIKLAYRDPNDTSSRVSASSLVTMEMDTDYRMSSISGGTGSNMSSKLDITVDPGANEAVLTLENLGDRLGYINLLQVRGYGIYTRDEVSITEETGDGDKPASINLPYQSDVNVARSLAQRIINKYSTPGTSVESVSFWVLSSTLEAYAINVTPQKRITLSEVVSGISGDYYVMGVEHTFGPNGSLLVTWHLDHEVGADNYWLLGDSTHSVLGSTTYPVL